MVSSGSTWGPMASPCEHANEPQGSHKRLGTYRLAE